MFPIHEFSDVDVTFSTKVKKFMPVMEDIPAEFKKWGGTKWNQFFNDWFFDGVENLELTPKEGVDPKKAVRHIRYLMARGNCRTSTRKLECPSCCRSGSRT